jgi:chromosome segregation ATPase
MIERVEPSICELIGRIDSALAEDDAEVSALKQEVSALKQELLVLREEMAGFKAIEAEKMAGFKAIEAEKYEAQQEAELTLSQLHQSQQELQHYYHYYLLCQKQSEMLDASAKLQAKSFRLLMRANN